MSVFVHIILSGGAAGVTGGDHFRLQYSGRSLFQLTLERNALFADRQLVVGHNEYYQQARWNLRSMGNNAYLNIIEEDELTNAYSVAFAAMSAGAEEILLVTPAHYMIRNDGAYQVAAEKLKAMAEQDFIGIMAFSPDDAIEDMPFIRYQAEKIIVIERAKDARQLKALMKSKKHLAYSGILCCKAGVYLKELKIYAPEVFKAARQIWDNRVGQYVAIEARSKLPLVNLEDILLPSSGKVKFVVMTAPRLDMAEKEDTPEREICRKQIIPRVKKPGMEMKVGLGG